MYELSESWGSGAHFIGEFNYNGLPEIAKQVIDESPDDGEWEIEIPDAEGLTLHIEKIDEED